MNTSRSTFTTLASAAIVAALALTGCGAADTPEPSATTTPTQSATPTPSPTPPTTPDTLPTEPAQPVASDGSAVDYASNTDVIEFAAGQNSYTAGGDTVTCEPDEAGNAATAVAVYILTADNGDPIGISEHTCLYDAVVEGDTTDDGFFDMSDEG
ncbi:hypothetical protein FQ330_03110 [Agrococcus sediminis]|uniref:HYR domain-containing protein n=1 Tax=Agrococcus sediminis TaxID=2599924 RepID=A0A5M8QMC7_9MICO|nr:hypothetical protein [Agrococcus sediminis]KAA6436408.1 hypothetical protein FQ330_03110 [Agrococcus sediminis]